MVGIAVVIPVLVLVMTTRVGGSTSVDPVTGVETVAEMEPMTNTWQVGESISGESSGMSSDIMSTVGKQKLRLSLIVSLCVGMLFFNIVPMMTPLDSTMMNVVLCLAGGALFSIGLGAVSNLVLRKASLV